MKKSLTQQAIADMIGVTRQTLSSWKRQGVDISEGNLPALREKAGHSKVTGELGRQIQEARLRKLIAEAEAKEHALEVERGNYVTRESQERIGIACGQIIKSLFMKIPTEIPQMLVGLDYPDALAKCEDYSDGLFEHFRVAVEEIEESESKPS